MSAVSPEVEFRTCGTRHWLDREADEVIEQAYAFDRRGERVAADALLAVAARLREIAGTLEGGTPDAHGRRS